MTVKMIHPGRYMQCQSFAILGTSGVVIVDPGSGYFEDEVIAGLREAGASPEDVCAILITHCHSDHAFGTDCWQKRGARLMASAPTAKAMRECAPLIWCEHTELITPVIIDDVLADGQILNIAGLRITCVTTPGHTPGCMSYLLDDDDGITAFTGDMLMPGSQPGWAGVDFSGEALLDSLQRLQKYNIRKVYPGHGAITGDINAWLETGIELGRAGKWQLNSVPISYEVPGK
ncbi:MAG: MBL fold metallo-hydrolase [bacterium]